MPYFNYPASSQAYIATQLGLLLGDLTELTTACAHKWSLKFCKKVHTGCLRQKPTIESGVVYANGFHVGCLLCRLPNPRLSWQQPNAGASSHYNSL